MSSSSYSMCLISVMTPELAKDAQSTVQEYSLNISVIVIQLKNKYFVVTAIVTRRLMTLNLSSSHEYLMLCLHNPGSPDS